MKKIYSYILVSFLVIAPAFAGESATVNTDKPGAEKEYKMRVDGLACPYCAYGIEKKFRKIDGVKAIDVDLKEGVVIICASDQISFSDDQLTRLFKDAGFTYRNMKTAEQCSIRKRP